MTQVPGWLDALASMPTLRQSKLLTLGTAGRNIGSLYSTVRGSSVLWQVLLAWSVAETVFWLWESYRQAA